MNDVKRILAATDGSPDAAEALEWLIHLPLPPEAAIEVVSVLPNPLPHEALAAMPWGELRAESERLVADACRRLAKRWANATGRVLEGDARQAIVAAATLAGSDLIVLGARGLGAVASFLLGSVSLGVTRHAPCPVLVCKGPARPVRAVTVAHDGSADAGAALDFVSRLPLPPALALRLVAVVEPPRYPSTAPGVLAGTLKAALQEIENERRCELERMLAPAADALRRRLGRVATATPTGPPAATILREAEAHDSDLIVVGARGLGAFERLALGSVSEAVLRHATCPVLVVRPRG